MASETERKYEDIRKEYQQKWVSKTYKGVKIHSDEFAFVKLAEKFYLSPKTIENILFYRTKIITN